MIDIHCHILPGIDDGAKTIEESVRIAELSSQTGVDKIIATPHHLNGIFENKSRLILNKVEELNKELQNRNIPVTIYPGAEIYLEEDVIDNIVAKKVPSLNNGIYVLIELPLNIIPYGLDNIIFELLIKKYIPVIAHPERNADLKRRPNRLYKLIEKGALVQMNAGSLLGKYGSKTQKLSKLFIKHKMVHFLGSDTHSVKKETSLILRWVEEASKIAGVDYATDIVTNLPNMIIESKEFEIPEPEPIKDGEFKKSVFRKIMDKILS